MAIKKIVLEVIGEQTIHCSGCENTIRRGLTQMPGVRQVEPSHKTQRIELTLDTDQVALEAVCEKLDRMGWQTRVPEGGSQ
jgi:copper chaperone CopZ